MYFLTDPLVQLALQHFDQIVNPGIEEGDWYFSTFGPGNALYATDRPFERFHDYENLLKLLQNRNHTNYEQIHKGTPFFFLAWLAFDLRNYEKTLYYLDAAISEDVRNRGDEWINFPGAGFLKLSAAPHVAGRVIEKIRSLLGAQINRFNSISSSSPIDIDIFIDKFVNHLMQNHSTRTIISALYVFLLESEERLIELRIKSTQGTSLGPVIANLFGVGLIFESLLKYVYPTNDNGAPIKLLGRCFKQLPLGLIFGLAYKLVRIVYRILLILFKTTLI